MQVHFALLSHPTLYLVAEWELVLALAVAQVL
jgi:hypothetical protein